MGAFNFGLNPHASRIISLGHMIYRTFTHTVDLKSGDSHSAI